MERAAFARVRSFLNYHPVAKWSALVSAVATAVLFVVLFLILTLFIDLAVNRGEIPCYSNLPPQEASYFRAQLNLSARRPAIARELRALGLGKFAGAALEQHPEALWFGELPTLLEDSVDAEAARQARQAIADNVRTIGPDATLYQNLRDFGILSLVVRTHSRLQGSLAAALASWNHWTWIEGNEYFLGGPFIAALPGASVR